MDKFEITVADNWEKMQIPGGVHISCKSGEILRVQVHDNNVTEAEDREILNELAQKYNGTPIAPVELSGVTFYTTTYTAYGKEQSFYSAVKNGEQIKIQMCGRCYETNADIKAMVDSIVFNSNFVNRWRTWSVDEILNTLYIKNKTEKIHSVRVGNICEAIAAKMGFSKKEIVLIRLAGLMHDIGEIGIDQDILNTPGAITAEEREEIQRHPELGYRILKSSDEFSGIADWVYEHHERPDGTGYPRGMKDEDISIEAKIVAIADAFDAMTSDLAYKNKISEEAAIEEIKRCSGTQFDPEIAKLFIRMILGRKW